LQKLYLFYGPLIIGGQRAPSGVGGEGFARLADASRFRIAQVERLGEDLLVVAYPCRMQQNRGQV